MIIINHCQDSYMKRTAREQGLTLSILSIEEIIDKKNGSYKSLQFRDNGILMAYYSLGGPSKHKMALKDRDDIGYFLFDLEQCKQERLENYYIIKKEHIKTFVACRELVELYLDVQS